MSVSISGDLIAIGAQYHGNGGAVYVYQRDDNGTPADASDDNWQTQRSKLIGSSVDGGDLFGLSVAIDGQTVVAGAPYDHDPGPWAGTAYVFSATQACPILADFAAFQACFSGPGGNVAPGCELFDYDSDNDIDLDDYATWFDTLTGP